MFIVSSCVWMLYCACKENRRTVGQKRSDRYEGFQSKAGLCTRSRSGVGRFPWRFHRQHRGGRGRLFRRRKCFLALALFRCEALIFSLRQAMKKGDSHRKKDDFQRNILVFMRIVRYTDKQKQYNLNKFLFRTGRRICEGLLFQHIPARGRKPGWHDVDLKLVGFSISPPGDGNLKF